MEKAIHSFYRTCSLFLYVSYFSFCIRVLIVSNTANCFILFTFSLGLSYTFTRVFCIYERETESGPKHHHMKFDSFSPLICYDEEHKPLFSRLLSCIHEYTTLIVWALISTEKQNKIAAVFPSGTSLGRILHIKFIQAITAILA